MFCPKSGVDVEEPNALGLFAFPPNSPDDPPVLEAPNKDVEPIWLLFCWPNKPVPDACPNAGVVCACGCPNALVPMLDCEPNPKAGVVVGAVVLAPNDDGFGPAVPLPRPCW